MAILKRNMSIEKVHEQLQFLFECNTSGSDIFIRDKYTIIVSNVSRLSSSQIACLNITMPEVSYDVLSSDVSDTGLAIVFTLNRYKHSQFSCLHSAITFVILLVACMNTWSVHNKTIILANDIWNRMSKIHLFCLKLKQKLRIKMLLELEILKQVCNAQLDVHSSTISRVMCI